MKRWKFLIAGVVVLAALGYLIYVGLASAMTYSYTIADLGKQGPSAYEQNLRVEGILAPGSKNDLQNRRVYFTLMDTKDNSKSLKVVFQGVEVPDTFTPGNKVTVEGKYTAAGVFEATTVIGSCPSKYIPGT